MADGDAWRDDWTMEDALKHLSNDCDELARCLRSGDEELAALVATALAKLRAPVTFRHESQSHVSARVDSTSTSQVSVSSTGGRAVAAAEAMLKAEGRSAPSESACTLDDGQMWKHVAGDHVEYFSQSAGGWIPAVVRGIDAQRGTYILDVQPVALPLKIRTPVEHSTGSRTSSKQRPSGSPQHGNIGSNPVSIGSIETHENGYHRAISSTAPEPNAVSACRHSIGEVVEYYSSSNQQWLRAVVQGFDESMGTYKLDVHPKAVPAKVRKTSNSLGGQQLPAPMNMQEKSLEKCSSKAVPEPALADSRTSRQQVTNPFLEKRASESSSSTRAPINPFRNSSSDITSSAKVDDERRPPANCSDVADWMSKQTDHGFQREVRPASKSSKEPPGEVSSSVQGVIAQRSSCGLCELHYEVDMLLGPPCSHLFCHGCLKAYVLKHDYVRQAIACPFSACKTEVESTQIRYIVGIAEYDKHRSEVDAEAVQVLRKEFKNEAVIEAANVSRKHTFKCPLCLEEVAKENSIELDCDHKFCAECFRNYLSSMISEAQVAHDELVCPIPKCGKEITVAQVQGATSDTPLWNKFLQFRMNIWVPTSGDGIIVECPTPNCEKYLVDKHMEVVKCRSCNKEFCPRCLQGAHKGSTCEAYGRCVKANSEADQHFEELMLSEGWKPCPVCGAPSERDSGCNFMQCRSSECRKRTYWCYICGLQKKREDHYTHFQKGPYEDQCKTPLHERKVVGRRKDVSGGSGDVGYAWGWLSYAAGAAGF